MPGIDDRMRALEGASQAEPLAADLPVYARLDGRGFSRFTKTMNRPFDERFTGLMLSTARYLARETAAVAAYTQSDEISLLWHWQTEDKPDGQALFGGRRQKLASVLAGMCTARFVAALADPASGLADRLVDLPHFDARIMNLPDQATAAQMFAWRGMDGRRNSINQAAHARFSHTAMNGVSVRRVAEMLREDGAPWKELPAANRHGTLLLARKGIKRLDDDTLLRIPPKHRPEGGVVPVTVYEEYSECSPDQLDDLQAVLFESAEPRPRRSAETDEPLQVSSKGM